MDIDIMPIYNGTVLAVSILIFLLGVVAVKSARSGWARLFIILAAALTYAAVFVGPVQLLSYAKPVSMEWVNRHVEEAEVLHAELREGDGIYLLLDWYGTPRYYKIPWDIKLAQQLLEAMEQARQQAGNSERPGSMPPEEEREGQQGEQGTLDQMLGPMGEEQGERADLPPGAEGQPGPKSQTTNAGNGKVMMRNPFKTQDLEEQQQRESDAPEGEGPSANFDDTESEVMFYAPPQPKYPEKVPHNDNI